MEESMKEQPAVRFYPQRTLPLRTAGKGVQMWAVALEKSMLTYFEIDPDSRFEMHSHESEQITMVLAGKLNFKVNEEEISVGPGDVIAIPSGVPHAAYTTDEAVKAVDAWSPVREEFVINE